MDVASWLFDSCHPVEYILKADRPGSLILAGSQGGVVIVKNLLILFFIGLVGFYAYQYFTKGDGSLSGEELAVQALEKEFHSILQDAKVARRSAATTGMDTTRDLELAILKAEEIGKKLADLMNELEESGALARGNRLKVEIDNFIDKN